MNTAWPRWAYLIGFLVALAALVAVLIFPQPVWADWGNAATAGIAFAALAKWPGIVMLLAALVGFIIVVRKHTDPSGYRFSFDHIWDVWTMGVITLLLLSGLWLFFRDEVRPSFHAPPPIHHWWE